MENRRRSEQLKKKEKETRYECVGGRGSERNSQSGAETKPEII